MDDRITRIERLAALHRDGALSDDEFRDEKLRVLSGREAADDVPPPAPPAPAPPPPPAEVVAPPPPAPPPPAAPVALEAAAIPVDGPVIVEPVEPDQPYAPPPPERSNTRWWIGGTAAAVAALAGAIWYAGSIEVADAPRSSIGTADHRTTASAPAPVADGPEEVATDVSDALAFSDVGECEFSREGERAFQAILSDRDDDWRTGGPVQLGAVTMTPKLEVTRTPGDDGGTSSNYTAYARAPEGVLWNGLKLSRLIHAVDLPAGRDGAEIRSITFLEDPDRVARTMRELGVTVPVGGGGRELEDGGCGGIMVIKPIPGGSSLVCQWGC